MRNLDSGEKKAFIRPSSIKELSIMYGIDRKTMSRWLKPHLHKIGERVGRYYNIRQMEVIFDVLGTPNCLF